MHHSSSNGDNIGEEGDHESSSSRKITHEQPESTINSPAVIELHHQQHHATISSCQHRLPTSSSVGDHLSQEDISSSSSSTTGEGTAVGGQANTTTRETYSSLVETPLLSSLPTTSTSTLSSSTNCSTQPTLEGKDILLPSPLITTTTESESTTTSSISTIPVVKGRGESTATVVDSSCCGSLSGSSSTGSLVGQQQGQPLRKEQSISNPVYRFPKQPTHRFQLPRQELAYYFDQTYLPFYSPTMSSSTIIPSNPPPLMPILGQQQLVPTIVTDQQSPVCSSTMSTYSTTPTSSSSSMSSNVLSPPRYGTTVPNRIFVGGITTDTTECDLESLFSRFGNINGVKIISDRAGVPRGYGFVTFDTEDDAKRVLREGDNLVLRGRKLNVAIAVKKQQSNAGGRIDVLPFYSMTNGAIGLGHQSVATTNHHQQPYPGQHTGPHHPHGLPQAVTSAAAAAAAAMIAFPQTGSNHLASTAPSPFPPFHNIPLCPATILFDPYFGTPSPETEIMANPYIYGLPTGMTTQPHQLHHPVTSPILSTAVPSIVHHGQSISPVTHSTNDSTSPSTGGVVTTTQSYTPGQYDHHHYHHQSSTKPSIHQGGASSSQPATYYGHHHHPHQPHLMPPPPTTTLLPTGHHHQAHQQPSQHSNQYQYPHHNHSLPPLPPFTTFPVIQTVSPQQSSSQPSPSSILPQSSSSLPGQQTPSSSVHHNHRVGSHGTAGRE